MKNPIKKSLNNIPLEDAHGGAGQRQLLFSQSEDISSSFEAWTKGFLPSGSFYDWHKHDDIIEMFIVLEGNGIIEYEDGTSFDYSPNDLFFNPENLPHKITDKSSTGSVFYFIRMKK